MKLFKYIILMLMAAFLVTSCNEGIDPISKVDPGVDETAPQITVKSPKAGLEVKSEEEIDTLIIQFVVTDDIEIGSITVSLDQTEIASYNEFLDYRRYVGEIIYDQLKVGDHVLTFKASDLEGKNTSFDVHFSKTSAYMAYVPKYNGEIFYMPFDGDYREFNSGSKATVVGTPEFAGESLLGDDAYKGATDSYLSYPASSLTGNEFSAAMWIKPNAMPDRAGILTVGPEDTANPGAENIRTSGFRFFREGSATEQRYKLNVGTGDAETWNDGGVIDPSKNEWVHLAFTISDTKCTIYINGIMQMESDLANPISWADCNDLSIMSGAPHFSGWSHLSDLSYLDELRLFNKVLTMDEIQSMIADESGIVVVNETKFDGEIFYLPFDGDLSDKDGDKVVTMLGTASFAGEGYLGGNAYRGATDAYLEVSSDGLLNKEMSATFWYKPNAVPERAGILTSGPEDTDNPGAENLRTSGFRFFREGSATEQRFKLNVGTGDAETWNDGGVIDPSLNEWVHLAFTISTTKCVIYINGELALEADMAAEMSAAGCSTLSIMSGAPHFTGWDHLSDLSDMDELRFYNKVLSKEEIQAVMNAK
ncbi:MAG: LamG domain-containing protein [Prolixibacteraceae bacterium]